MQETIDAVATEIVAEYNPQKSYGWEVETPFVLTGAEFGMIYNTLLKKKSELLMQLDVLNVLEGKLRLAVETGAAKEVEQPKS